jgi:hypothetical protein
LEKYNGQVVHPFLMYLMFSVHGQRTQVYRYLLVPSNEQLESWTEHQISLAVQWDKIPRSLECPGVVLPGKARDLFLSMSLSSDKSFRKTWAGQFN